MTYHHMPNVGRNDKMKNRIIHAQTVMLEEQLEKLKEKTKQTETKEAIRIAIEAYLEAKA